MMLDKNIVVWLKFSSGNRDLEYLTQKERITFLCRFVGFNLTENPIHLIEFQ